MKMDKMYWAIFLLGTSLGMTIAGMIVVMFLVGIR